jgi:methyltransferase
MFFIIVMCLIIVQRLVELYIANRNRKWMINQGGYEVGQEHYIYLVLLHATFFISIIAEVNYMERSLAFWWYVPFAVFCITQGIRIWCLFSLGRFWNTRIVILPGAKVVAKGPYRFLRHPNYLIVITEILVIPLIFQAYFSSVIFTLLNALVLYIRIPYEEKALQEATNYDEVFKSRSRFIPK